MRGAEVLENVLDVILIAHLIFLGSWADIRLTKLAVPASLKVRVDEVEVEFAGLHKLHAIILKLLFTHLLRIQTLGVALSVIRMHDLSLIRSLEHTVVVVAG